MEDKKDKRCQPDESNRPEFAKPKTSYRKLYCYQKGVAIYDLTYLFLKDHISTKDRTHDQMLQSARSGKTNIVEGRTDATVSLQMEINLYGVSIGSLEELLNDYEDYMRTHNIPFWDYKNPRFGRMKDFCAKNNLTEIYTPLYSKLNDEEFCNMMLTLIHQNLSMTRKLQEYAKEDFLKLGGIKEQMYQARVKYRDMQNKNTRKP